MQQEINKEQQPRHLSQALQRGFKIIFIEFTEGRNCLVTVQRQESPSLQPVRFTLSAKYVQQKFLDSLDKLS